MKNINFKKLLPHIIAVVVFLIVAVIFCKPALEGKVLSQHDTISWRGMAQQSFDVKEKTGHWPLWTNSMFSGMPAYQIALDSRTQVGVGIYYFTKVLSLGLPEPMSFFFIACFCFYILCLVLRLNPWVGILAALAYSYSTYDPVIISAGHITKMISLGYAPMVVAGMLLLFQKRYLLGFLTTALFGSILISQNHLQIVYYSIIIIGVLTISFFINAVKQKETLHAIKATVLGLVAGILGLATCAVSMMPTYEYAKESMRGGISKLTLNKEDSTNNKTKGGLDKNYALKWSIGTMETFTFMVPGLYGGSNSGGEYREHKTSALTDVGLPEESALGLTNAYSYWGSMSKPSETTSGPVYLGAIICMLAIFSLFYVKNWHKWWLVAASVIGILLAWGSNLKGFNYAMLDYLPYYSKFRAPSMAMVIPQFCIPLLAALGLSKLLDEEKDWSFAWKKFKHAAIAVAAVLLVITAFYFTTDFVGVGDKEIKESLLGGDIKQATPDVLKQVNDVMIGIRADRKSLAGSDLGRSLLFIVLGISLVGLFIKRKINALVVAIGLIFLSTIDLIGIDKRYLNYDDFKDVENVDGRFEPTAVDLELKKDPDHGNFRVFNTSNDFTNESITSYHHNSIGGYHAAKLGLYQDLLVNQIYKNNPQVINMLNVKYFIGKDQSGKPGMQQNPEAFGNCWLVKGIKFVSGPNEEMTALDSTNLRDTAVVDNDFKASIKQLPQYDSTAFIKVAVRENDKITYTFSAATPQFAVFSEIYYSAGWDAFIDGQKVDYAKVNYALRGLYVPPGKHNIEFKFEPKSFATGRSITIWSTVIIYLLALVAIVMAFLKRKKL